METIIVATDFSPEAENALEYAGAMAKQLKAKVILFNSFNLPVHTANTLAPPSAIESIVQKNKSLLNERAQKLASDYGINVAYEAELMSDVSNELETLFSEHNAELIVMGMASRSLAQEIFGNTTTSAIMKLKFPVLAVPPTASYDPISKILFAVESYDEIAPSILWKVKVLAAASGASVEFFHVETSKTDETFSVNHIDLEMGDVGHYYKQVTSGNVLEAIEKEMREQHADLLIMLPRKYGFWESFIHSSKTRLMASNNEVPLLSIPA